MKISTAGKHAGSKEVRQDQCPRLLETWPADLFISTCSSQRTFVSCSEGAQSDRNMFPQKMQEQINYAHLRTVYTCIYLCVYQIMRMIMHPLGSIDFPSVGIHFFRFRACAMNDHP